MSLLEGFRARHQLKQMLVMGKTCGEFLFQTQGEGEDELFSGVEMQGMTVRHLPGLSEMLTKPVLKRDAWEQIRDLVQGD